MRKLLLAACMCALAAPVLGGQLTEDNLLHRTDAGDFNFIHPVPEIIVEQEIVFDRALLDPANGRTDHTNAQDGFVWGDMFHFADGRAEPECVTGHRGFRTFKLAGELESPLRVRSRTKYPDRNIPRTWQYRLSGAQLPDYERFGTSISGSARHDQARCRDYGTGGWVIKFPHEVTAFSFTLIVNSVVFGQQAGDPIRSCIINHTEEKPERVHIRPVNFDAEIVGHLEIVKHTEAEGCIIIGSFVSEVAVGGIELWIEGLKNFGIKSVAIGTAAVEPPPPPPPLPPPPPPPDTSELDQCILDRNTAIAEREAAVVENLETIGFLAICRSFRGAR